MRFFLYTYTCSPNKDELVIRRTAARQYGKFIGFILKDLIIQIDINHFVNSFSIYEQNYINADDVINTRVKAKLLIKQINENRHSIDTFQYNEDLALLFFRGLDDVTEDIIDKVMQCPKDIFQDYIYV